VIKRLLALGTYPSAKPVHGGQRRVAAFRSFYGSIGIEYIHACIYNSDHYAPSLVGPYDIPLASSASDEGPLALIGDVMSGRQGTTDAASFRHFQDVVERLQPDALQLEQPFMWPLAKRLRETRGTHNLPLIYSSHNVEAPLKNAILASGGVGSRKRQRMSDDIEQMEAEICREAALVVCVSASERDYYLKYCSPKRVIVVPNGVDRPPAVTEDYALSREIFGDRRFMFVVGSAYAPNIEGFCDLVIKDGPFMVPPVKSIAVCGGVSDGVLGHPLYQRFHAANSTRIHFFPRIEDSELWALKHACHVVALPIETGTGSNLKTAEALTLGKHVVATTVAMRGYESFRDTEGLILADDPPAFRSAIARALCSPPLVLSDSSRRKREALYWDRCFADSKLEQRISNR
jgi:glycosyltransferase involved in cell wall biosynthesis